MTTSPDGAHGLRQALRGMRPALIAAFVFAGLLNVLALTGALYMMQIYDRVIPSRSIASLVALSVLALILFCSHGVLDVLRGRILLRLSRAFDERLGSRLFRLISRSPSPATARPSASSPCATSTGSAPSCRAAGRPP
jgi:ATP-binding cassette subfamily C protein